jgi:DNA-binding LytR/AlgR family response regulator
MKKEKITYKEHILIVEDEALIYYELATILNENNYSVDTLTKSVNDAIIKIKKQRPDLVLLDIKLEGELTGLDLGEMLYKEYKIPFIYITEFDDNGTFDNALRTFHESFIVKSKPIIDENLLLREIRTAINNQPKRIEKIIRDGIMVYVDYIEATEKLGKDNTRQVPIKYEDVLYFTTLDVKDDYFRVVTKDEKLLLFNDSLKKLYDELPYNFVRVYDNYIVNITHPAFIGRINGSTLNFNDKIINISPTFRQEYEKRMAHFYKTKPKK